MADAPARLGPGSRTQLLLWGWAAGVLVGCLDGATLAISAGAPVAGAIQGRITDCGSPLSGATVVIRIQQDEPYQSRAVDTQVGPVSTDWEGRYVIEVGPAFAVPGPARVWLQTVNGVVLEVEGPDLSFQLGTPARDTVRFDADIGLHRGNCPS